jgi:branched-chain amino acid transport system substrate-binding protein
MKKNCFIAFMLVGTLLLFPATSLWAQSSKVIKIGAPIPLGGAGGAYVGIAWGYNDCQSYFAAKGGIRGYKVVYLVEDNRWDVITEIAVINRQLTMEPKEELLLFCGNLITGTLKALSEKINQEVRIPSIALSYSVEMFGSKGGPSKYPYYFSFGPDYSQQVGLLLRYIKRDHKKDTPPRLAVVYSPTEYGRDPLSDLKEDVVRLGIKIVAEEEMAITASDVTSQIINIRKAQPDYIIWHGFLPGMLVAPVFLKTARQYLPKVPILGTHYQTTLSMILAGAQAADGLIGVSTQVQWEETNNPFVRLVHEQAAKSKRQFPAGEPPNYMGGWILGLMAAHAVDVTVASGDVSREGMKKALEKSTWDFDGMYEGRKFSYASHKVPMARIYKASFAQKQWNPITPWLNADEELK